MKIVKYKVGKSDLIGLIPANSIILNAKIVTKDVSGTNALILLPKRTKYQYKNEILIDEGTSSLSFAVKSGNYWIRSGFDYINLPDANRDAEIEEPLPDWLNL